MAIQLARKIEQLKAKLLALCDQVEKQLTMALEALENRDQAAAEKAEQHDALIDQFEIELEEDCLHTLALYQPVASDLRLIISALKINTDLERVGDLAVNIAHKAAALAKKPDFTSPVDLKPMAAKVRTMLRDSIRALVDFDATLAQQVCAADDEVDAMKRQTRVRIEQLIQEQPDAAAALLRLLAVARNLERVGDSATNIAEDVVYLIEGHIIRHGTGDH